MTFCTLKDLLLESVIEQEPYKEFQIQFSGTICIFSQWIELTSTKISILILFVWINTTSMLPHIWWSFFLPWSNDWKIQKCKNMVPLNCDYCWFGDCPQFALEAHVLNCHTNWNSTPTYAIPNSKQPGKEMSNISWSQRNINHFLIDSVSIAENLSKANYITVHGCEMYYN